MLQDAQLRLVACMHLDKKAIPSCPTPCSLFGDTMHPLAPLAVDAGMPIQPVWHHTCQKQLIYFQKRELESEYVYVCTIP
mmetsp:Transcript_147380/g.257614  ORF Transcript_147380/g.257614 Transcript_147380/m.257614 type:complete len:80 (-) Transcript_147380:805-1044(-)